MPTTPERQQAERWGRLAEMITAWRYRLTGHRLIHHRYRCFHGEIDLIMARGRNLVFIEVKFARSRTAFSLEKTLPGARQQARITAAADHFLMQSGMVAENIRFDVVVVQPPLSLQVFRDAIRR